MGGDEQIKIGDVNEVHEESSSDIVKAQPKENAAPNENLVVTENAAPTREPGFSDYVRVFSYARKWDIVLMVAAATASIGAGVTMPLMTVVFGRLVGGFSDFGSGNGPTEQGFKDTLNKQCLYMFALFIARFGLNYINKVGRHKTFNRIQS